MTMKHIIHTNIFLTKLIKMINLLYFINLKKHFNIFFSFHTNLKLKDIKYKYILNRTSVKRFGQI